MFHEFYFHELSMAQDTLTTVEKVIRSTTIALLEDRTKGVSMPGCQVRRVARFLLHFFFYGILIFPYVCMALRSPEKVAAAFLKFFSST